MRTESSFRWQFNGASAPVTPHKRQKRTCTERRWGKRVHGSIRTLERRGRDTHGEQTDAWIRATGWTPATWQFRWPRRYSLTVTPRASILDSAYLLAFPFTYLLTYLLTYASRTHAVQPLQEFIRGYPQYRRGHGHIETTREGAGYYSRAHVLVNLIGLRHRRRADVLHIREAPSFLDSTSPRNSSAWI